jgi:hypothetical protein
MVKKSPAIADENMKWEAYRNGRWGSSEWVVEMSRVTGDDLET